MSTRGSSLGIAILGAGLFAKLAHLPAIAKLRDLAVLRAVYSRSKKSALELVSEAETTFGIRDVHVYSDDGDSLDSLLTRSDIDAIIVALPITTQPDIILKCLAAGKHVLSEKPVGPTVSDGLKLIESYESKYKAKKLLWRVAENFEAEPAYISAGAAIRAGKIGKVISFNLAAINNLDKSSKWYNTPWRTVPDYQGGFVLDGGVHSAALLRVVLPGAITHLVGFASLNKDYLAPTDTVISVIKTLDGASGTFEISFAAPSASLGPKKNGVVITGSEGWAEIGNAKTEAGVNVFRTTIHRPGKDGAQEELEILEEPVCGVEKELESFFNAVGGNDDGKGLGEPREALKDVMLIQAALTSNGALIELAKIV